MSQRRERQPVGSLKISADVIATIAEVAALEIEGVEALAQPTQQVSSFLYRRMGRKAVDVSITDEFAEIDIQLNLKFGARITEVCSAVQASVKDSVQTMTGMAVSKVNVVVAGIVFPNSEEAQA